MKSNLDNMRDQLNFLAEKLLSTSNKENLTQEQLINIQKQVSSLRNLKYEYNIDEQEKKEIKAIKDKPSQKDIQDLNVTYKRGNFASAEKKALELIKTYSDNPEVYEVLSLSCLKQKKYINAITFIKKAIEIDPNIDHYHVNLGLILRTMGRIEEAKAVYRKAININPNNYIVYNNLAFYSIKKKDLLKPEKIISSH